MDLYPPQQARSREALRRILASAEHVLVTDGADDFTMAAVADHAGVSIGAMYRRFPGKEQLLNAVKDRLLSDVEARVAEDLRGAGAALSDVVEAFTLSLADALSTGSRVIPVLLSGRQSPEAAERGGRFLATLHRLFLDGAVAHVDEIRRPDPMTALGGASRMIIGAAVYRTISSHGWPDGLSWKAWAQQVADMAVAYLTTPDRHVRA